MKKSEPIIPRMTSKEGTETIYGFIPHAPYALEDGQIINAPVLLEKKGRGLMTILVDNLHQVVPVKTSNGFIHALPGGGSFEYASSQKKVRRCAK